MGLLDLTVVEMKMHFACLPSGNKSVPQGRAEAGSVGNQKFLTPGTVFKLIFRFLVPCSLTVVLQHGPQLLQSVGRICTCNILGGNVSAG